MSDLQLSLSDLNLIYSCTREKTLMMETQAREISNKDLIDALHLAHSEVNISEFVKWVLLMWIKKLFLNPYY